MRVVMLLRPTNRHGTKGEYTQFRKLLVANGFVLVQSEVFMCAVPTRRSVRVLLDRMKAAAPTTGSVCALVLTERQYSSIEYLVGGPSYQERAIGSSVNISL